MAYAQIIAGSIAGVRGVLPASARRLDTREWVMGLATAPQAAREATGWFAIVETEQPADTDTDTQTSSVQLVDGVPTRVWTATPKPPPPPLSAEERLALIRQQLTDLDAPYLPADIVDILSTALEP